MDFYHLTLPSKQERPLTQQDMINKFMEAFGANANGQANNYQQANQMAERQANFIGGVFAAPQMSSDMNMMNRAMAHWTQQMINQMDMSIDETRAALLEELEREGRR